MTPQEAVAKTSRRLRTGMTTPPDEYEMLEAGDFLAALAALGFTVARTEHAADGEALARLREAMNPSDGLLLALTSRGVVQASVAVIPAEHRGIGDPVSKAADACRAQLERAAIEATR